MSPIKPDAERIEQLELAIVKCDEGLQLDYSEGSLNFLRKLRAQHVAELAALREKAQVAA
jgi:hypothetical protein